MLLVREITEFLATFAPPALAEDWDNVGLLVGDEQNRVASVMTCLTLTPDVAAEAVREQAGLVISHHPVLFRPVQRITAETVEGRTLLELTAARVSVYSPHTSYDSARDGINQQLAEMFGLRPIRPLRPHQPDESPGPGRPEWAGAGRFGDLEKPTTVGEFNGHVKRCLRIERVQFVGDAQAEVIRVGVACGSAADFLQDARREDCQVLVTGEARFHACLQALHSDVSLVLVGHYASERPAVERLAEVLQAQFPGLTVWASRAERDPLQWA